MKRQVVLGLAALALCPVFAATIVWNGGGGDGLWTTAANWTGGNVPGEGDVASFSTTGLPADNIVRLNGNQTVQGIAYNNGSPAQIQGDGQYSLTLTAGTVSGNMPQNPPGTNSGLYCNIIQSGSGIWRNADSYGQIVCVKGNISGTGEVYCAGNQNNTVRLGGGVFSAAGLYARAAGVQTCSGTFFSNTIVYIEGSYADSNFNGTALTLGSDLNYAGQYFDDSAVLATSKSGGGFVYNAPTNQAVNDILPVFQHRSGRLMFNFVNNGFESFLSITNFTRSPGSFAGFKYTKNTGSFPIGTGQGIRLPHSTNNSVGILGPWAFSDHYFVRLDGEQRTIKPLTTSDYLTFPDSGGNPTNFYRTTVLTNVLAASQSIYSYLSDKDGSSLLDLGPHDLTLAGGAMVWVKAGNQKVASSGGRLIFAADEIVLYATGSGEFRISAPIAWQRPAGSEAVHPNLILPSAAKTDGIILDGEDLIGDYGSLAGEGKGKYLVFDGASNREIHGAIADSIYIEQRGSGTLTLSGPDNRRSRGTRVTGGKLVLKNEVCTVPSLVTNAVLEVAEGITLASAPLIEYSGTFQGFATVAAGLNASSLEIGAALAPGNETKAGTITFRGSDTTTAGSFSLICRIDAVTNGMVAVTSGKFTFPPVGSVMTLRISDLTAGTRHISPGDVFTVLDWNGTGSTVNPSNGLLFEVVNDSPKHLDTSKVVVSLNTAEKTVTFSGLRQISGTILILQ